MLETFRRSKNRFHEPLIYSTWSAEVAKQVYAPLLDVHKLIADRYDREGKDVVSTYFNSPGDPCVLPKLRNYRK